MKTQKVTLSVFLWCTLGILFLLTGCQYNDDASSLESGLASKSNLHLLVSEEQVIKESTPVIQGFFDSQYRYLIGEDKTPQWDTYIATGSKKLQKAIDTYRQIEHENYSMHYFDYESVADMSQAKVTTGEDGIWHIDHVVDRYMLADDFDEDAPDIDEDFDPYDHASRGGWIYHFTLKYDDGQWIILDWQEYNNILGNNRWYLRRLHPSKKDSALNERDKRDKLAMRSFSHYYDASKAVQYAKNHYNNPSSNYPDYSGYGGDCTNFVSQCLEAGGWKQTSMNIPRNSSQAWYHKRGSYLPAIQYRSASWTSASHLSEYLRQSDRVYHGGPFVLKIGDIVQLYDFADGVHHSMIVTYKRGDDVRVAYRNAEGYNVEKEISLYDVGTNDIKINHYLKTYY